MKIVMPCQYLAFMPGEQVVFLHMDTLSVPEKDTILQALVTNKDNIFPTDSIWKRLQKGLVINIDYGDPEDKDVIDCATIGQYDDREGFSDHEKTTSWRQHQMHNSDINIFVLSASGKQRKCSDISDFFFYFGYAQGAPETKDTVVFTQMESTDSPLAIAKEIARFLSEIESD